MKNCQVCSDIWNATPPISNSPIVLCHACEALMMELFPGQVCKPIQVSFARGFKVGMLAKKSYEDLIKLMPPDEPFVSVTINE